MRCYFFDVVTPPGTSIKELQIPKPLCDILLVFLQQEANDVQRHVNTLGGLFTFLITAINNNTHFEVFIFLHLKLHGCFDLVNLRHKQINKENNLFGKLTSTIHTKQKLNEEFQGQPLERDFPKLSSYCNGQLCPFTHLIIPSICIS